ncbi:hypothetical protein [Thermococcus waiotapuensis]|uniref:Uncharacterized protein n=1 Tax=Thermococcus waiotapuensis TaxID=90909 RepID=A0AAE4NUD5_9EURY|nr:hypothetical protein [Thermococcus waiotapuensis]MDV3103497.1 hypothetical protein [Thermococcus waiotapuensis]
MCSLKDQTVKVEADVPEWIDSNAAFYITYSHLDYLGLLWEEIKRSGEGCRKRLPADGCACHLFITVEDELQGLDRAGIGSDA